MKHYQITVLVPGPTYRRLCSLVSPDVAPSPAERASVAVTRAIAAAVRTVPDRRSAAIMAAEDVRAARVQTGLSARAFGVALGVSRETVKAWEAGRRTCRYQAAIRGLVRRVG